MIPVFQPTLGENELASVREVFAEHWPGPGPRAKAFEASFAAYLGGNSEEFIAITSCTEGLFQAIAALDLEPHDEVIMPTISFVGAAHAVRAAGARLRLADVDSTTLNPCPRQLLQAVSRNTRAIVLLHFGGRSIWIKEVAQLAKERNLVLIEDSACGLGGHQDGKAFGLFGDVGVWSFDAMKLLVTGDGGMIRVSDPALRRRIMNRVSFGGARSGFQALNAFAERWWEVDPLDWGRNGRMNDLTAAIGQVQLRRVDEFIARRRIIAESYDRAFEGLAWLRRPPARTGGEVLYFYWVQTAPKIRDNLAIHLRDRGIYTTFRYWPLHRMEMYADAGSYPGADAAAEATLLLPVHQNLTDVAVQYIVDMVRSFDP